VLRSGLYQPELLEEEVFLLALLEPRLVTHGEIQTVGVQPSHDGARLVGEMLAGAGLGFFLAFLLMVLVVERLGDELVAVEGEELAVVAQRSGGERVPHEEAEEVGHPPAVHELLRQGGHVVPPEGLRADVEGVLPELRVSREEVHHEAIVVARGVRVAVALLALPLGESHAHGLLDEDHRGHLGPGVGVGLKASAARGAEGPLFGEMAQHPRAPRPAVRPEHHGGVREALVGLHQPVEELAFPRGAVHGDVPAEHLAPHREVEREAGKVHDQIVLSLLGEILDRDGRVGGGIERGVLGILLHRLGCLLIPVKKEGGGRLLVRLGLNHRVHGRRTRREEAEEE